MTLTVSGVEDLVGNPLLRPVTWSIEIEKLESLSSKSTLEGVILNTPYLVQYADASSETLADFMKAISKDIATLLKIPVSFLSLMVKELTTGSVSLDFSITTLA